MDPDHCPRPPPQSRRRPSPSWSQTLATTAQLGPAATRRAARRAASNRGVPAISHPAEPKATIRVAIYIRISTDEEHQPYSLDAQLSRLKAYIATQPGWTFTGLVFEDQKSGATTDRENLQRALRAATEGEYDILLAYRVDRLSRSLRGLVEILDKLDSADVGFRSATEPVDTSNAVGRMLVQMLGVFAQFEREVIIDRVVRALELKATKGEWCGGRVPHGYELDKQTGRLRVRDAEADTVRLIFSLYVRERLGVRGVAARLNDAGHRTRRGTPWSGATILAMLRNRAYLGEVYYRGTWHRAARHHDPIVDEKLFDQAQAQLDTRSEDYSKRASSNSSYTLAGAVMCDRCGSHFIGSAATGRNGTYRYYTCYTRQRYGTKACPADRLPADDLEQQIADALIAVYRDTPLITDAVTRAARSAQAKLDVHNRELAAVDAETRGLEDKVIRYQSAFESGQLDATALNGRLTDLREQLTQLAVRRAELVQLVAAVPTAPSQEEINTIQAEIRTALDQGTGAVKYVYELLIDTIRVAGRGQITPYFRIPTTRGKQDNADPVRMLISLAPPIGLEPITCRLTVGCSAN